MIRRGTWIVLGLFGVLLAFTLWWQRARPGPSEIAEATPTLEPLWNVGEAQIVWIQVEDLVSEVIVEAERQADGTWRLLQPQVAEADTARLEQAAAWLELPVPRAQLADADDLSVFGLDTPLQRVSARLDDGQELAFVVGDEAPTGTVTYIALESRPGVLVMSKYGLAEVLGLLDPLPLPQPTATNPVPAATQTVSASPEVTETPTPAASSTP